MPEKKATAARSETRKTKAEKPLRILMVTAEAHPFAKTGGLAEVAAALPAALGRLGHNVTLVLPRYRGAAPDAHPTRSTEIEIGRHTFEVGFVEQQVDERVTVVLVDVPSLFDRAGLYAQDGIDYPDNALRFAVLSRAALEYARQDGQRYDVIHAHDWQAGLVPVYQKLLLSNDSVVGGIPSVFTIHNLAFQGVFERDTVSQVGLGWEVFNPEGLEYWGNISFLKGGVNFSERITTVSPTYAKEILTPEFGFGFEGVMQRRAADLIGILNGIDTVRWNPAADGFVPSAYTANDLAGKNEAKCALLQEVGLTADEAAMSRPLVGLISRLTDQKGFDLIGISAGELMELDASWVMLGSGQRHYEDLWRTMASRHPDRVSATIGFDERLAHLIEAGADMFLMPSRFEPCGLNQLYSLRYGTVPIVRATGGLEDTVVDAELPGGNGIKFAEYSRGAMVGAVRRALELYADRPRWRALQRSGMATDPSWDASAREYVKVYRGQRNGI
ncbi:MAG: glycogen synthase GlgA [Acidobacteriota bacterium]|nr:glycogen synthase GlgA [Acidobacteriota bacterium]